jgi:protein tyrosine kinase modulator
MKSNLKYYLSIFMRRLHYFLLVVIIVSTSGFIIATILPAQYRSEALLLVQSEQIPDRLASSTVRTGVVERMQIIEQQLLASGTLLDIAMQFELYSAQPGLTRQEIVDDMRMRILIDARSRRGAATTIAVIYEGNSAAKTLQVTNDIAARILQASVDMRTSSAVQTLEFFKQEVARLGADLDRNEAALLDFRTSNQDSLPDSISYRRSKQNGLQERALQLQREAGALIERRVRLAALFKLTGRTARSEAVSPELRLLQRLEAELASLLLTFSPQSPQARLLQRRVDAQRQAVVSQQSSSLPVEDPQVDLTPFDIQQAEIDGQLSYLSVQQSQLEGEIEILRLSIASTPAVAAELSELERDNAITQGQYNAMVNRLAEAQTGERIESLSKGQRIVMIGEPVLPTDPYSPDRKLIAGGSVLGGMVLGLALVLLLELLNQAIRRPSEIVAGLGLTPIATLPYIRTRREVVARRNIIAATFLGAVISVTGSLYVIHQFYMPVDMIIGQISNRISP